MIKKKITITDEALDQPDLTEQKLIDAAKNAVHQAYAPYSKFQVGAAVLLENGEIITGSNQENAAYPSGICAERTAIFQANHNFPNQAVVAIAIAAYTNGQYLKAPITPCGSCRQVLSEVEHRYGKEIAVYLYGEQEIYKIESIDSLLPFQFKL